VISAIFHAAFYNPIYNGLVALVAFLPGGDVGLAVIVLTIIIRLLLLPFSLSAARTQRAMRELEPQLKEIKERNKGDKEKEGLETFALLREARVHPFASVLTLFLQLPVLFALYFVFLHEPFPALNLARLYAFTPTPDGISLEFLGLISVASKSLMLALVAGLTQYLQARLALAGTMKPAATAGMQGDFQKILGLQLKYVFPLLIGFVAYTTSGAIALYFVTTNLVGSLQELYVRKKLAKEFPAA
jgi:YidC/Oxa1 family membrane protein insertase